MGQFVDARCGIQDYFTHNLLFPTRGPECVNWNATFEAARSFWQFGSYEAPYSHGRIISGTSRCCVSGCNASICAGREARYCTACGSEAGRATSVRRLAGRVLAGRDFGQEEAGCAAQGSGPQGGLERGAQAEADDTKQGTPSGSTSCASCRPQGQASCRAFDDRRHVPSGGSNAGARGGYAHGAIGDSSAAACHRNSASSTGCRGTGAAAVRIDGAWNADGYGWWRAVMAP